MSNEWHAKWLIPQHDTHHNGLMIDIDRAPKPLPADRVQLTVSERDVGSVEVDDYDNKANDDTERNDWVATFEGTLIGHPSNPKGAVLNVDTIDMPGQVMHAPGHVWIALKHGLPPVQCPIWSTGWEPVEATGFGEEDGEFYELGFTLAFVGGDGAPSEPFFVSEASLIRRRTNVLLAVEPIGQASSSLGSTPMGRAIRTYFHDGKKDTDNRQWGDYMLRIRSHGGGRLSSAGCSYAIVTMLIRYLRVPRAGEPDAYDTLYDLSVGATTLLEKHKPFKQIGTVQSNGSLTEADAQSINAQAKTLWKENKHQWQSKPKVKNKGDWKPAPDVSGSDFVEDGGDIKEHWWLARLLWYVRQLEGQEETFEMGRQSLFWEFRVKDGSKKGRVEHGGPVLRDGKPILKLGFLKAGKAGGVAGRDGLVMPISLSLRKKLGLELVDHLNRESSRTDEQGVKREGLARWEAWAKRYLDLGLPIVVLFSSGMYSRRTGGGHYCMIVGYRQEGELLRFIINDPSGAKKLQYACQYETEVPIEQKDDGNGNLVDKKAKKWEDKGWHVLVERRYNDSMKELHVYAPADTSWKREYGRFLPFN